MIPGRYRNHRRDHSGVPGTRDPSCTSLDHPSEFYRVPCHDHLPDGNHAPPAVSARTGVTYISLCNLLSVFYIEGCHPADGEGTAAGTSHRRTGTDGVL